MAPHSPLFRDDFQGKESYFTLPEHSTDLDSRRKRASPTICNLFINHNLSISSIVRVLDEDEGSVVLALIENGIVYNRRRILGRPPLGIERPITNGANSS